MNNKGIVFILLVICLAIGAAIGYFYGFSQGKVVGGQEVVSEAVSDVAEVAENPLEDVGYENPFEDVKTNPFAE